MKNHEKRPVPLPRSFADELRDLVDGRLSDALLFTASEGGPLRTRTSVSGCPTRR